MNSSNFIQAVFSFSYVVVSLILSIKTRHQNAEPLNESQSQRTQTVSDDCFCAHWLNHIHLSLLTQVYEYRFT